MTELDPAYRITNSEEVAQGLTAEQALVEASRCLDCPNPTCVTGCPVNINIPSFIKNIQRGHFDDAARVLRDTSALPPSAAVYARKSVNANRDASTTR